MYKYILGLLATMLMFSACFKKDVCEGINAPMPTNEELASLKTFVDIVDPEAIYDSRGFYYRIVKAGSANKPGICSDIHSNFNCTDGEGYSYFQSANDQQLVTFDLSDQNYVWRMAYPMIGMGGEILVYAPPSLRGGYHTKKATIHASSSVPTDLNVMYRLVLMRYN